MIFLLPLSFLSGVCGRLGGAEGYNKLWRRLGCSIILVLSIALCFGHVSSCWFAYLLTLLLTWGALSTYWDRVFGYDNLFFSGLMVGVAAVPLMFISPVFVWLVPVRAVILAITWHLLNMRLPDRVLLWRRDVAEEFLRYTVSL